MISCGETAPGFRLRGTTSEEGMEEYTLESLTDDAALLLGFYPYDFSPVCTEQICEINDLDWLTFEDRLNVAAISGDGIYAHHQFSRMHRLSYPLLSDYELSVSEAFDVLGRGPDGPETVPQRSLFLVSPEKTVEYVWSASSNGAAWDSSPLQTIKDRFDELAL